jgi:hypothetical protein
MDTENETSEALLERLAESAKRQQAAGRLPKNITKLTELGATISGDLLLLASHFDEAAKHALPHACRRAIAKPFEHVDVSEVVDDECQQRFMNMGAQLKALSAAFRETSAILKQTLDIQDDQAREILRRKALYWVKELEERSPHMLEMIKYLRDKDEALEAKVNEKLHGSTPWEQAEIEEEMAEGLAAAAKLLPAEQEEIVEEVLESYKRSTLVKLENRLGDAIEHMTKVHEFMKGERISSEIAALVALRTAPPETTVRLSNARQ